MSHAPTIPSLYEIVTLDTVDSVVEEGRRRALAGAEEGTLIWATQQTNAYTHAAQRWLSPPGNLYCALVMRPDYPKASAEQLCYVAAVSAGHALASKVSAMTGLRYRWPNRLLLNDLMAGTIQFAVPRSSADQYEWVVLALWVNVAEHPLNPEPERYSSVHACGAGEVSPGELLEAYTRQFLRWVNRWAEEGFEPVRKAWLMRADGVNEPLPQASAMAQPGIFKDIDSQGNLVLQSGDIIDKLAIGDVFSPGVHSSL